MSQLYLGAAPVSLPGPAYLGSALVFTPPPAWPADTVAAWVVMGQSNAMGWAPYAQDPAKLDAAQAVPALTEAERAVHPWIRFTPDGAPASGTGGQFSQRGLATAATPRTAANVWNDPGAASYGIPDGTPSFASEAALVRHVLTDPSAKFWRNDADPRLYFAKAGLGSTTVDRFRWGGDRWDYALGALSTAAGTVNLGGLAEGKTVLLQGLLIVIGEADANLAHPSGTGRMGENMAPRLVEWVRQARALLGQDVPVVLGEVFENGADRVNVNAQLALAAGQLSNAHLLTTDGLETADDGTHYDAAAQLSIGSRAWGWVRDNFGRAGDGLVDGFPFQGFQPAFLLPPTWESDGGARMTIATAVSAPGILHLTVTEAGATPPTPAELIAGTAVAGFIGHQSRAGIGIGHNGFVSDAIFPTDRAVDVHFILEESLDPDGPTGRVSEVVTVRKPLRVRITGNGGFPAVTLGPAGSGEVTLDWTANHKGTDTWAVWAEDRPNLRAEDVELGAFEPAQWGQLSSPSANSAQSLALTGLAPGVPHTVMVACRGAPDYAAAPDELGVCARVTFTPPA